MSKTIRIYNKHPIIGGPGFQGWISSQKLTSRDIRAPTGWAFYDYYGPWIGYDPHRQFSRMRGWKDWRMRSRRRQMRKMEERRSWNEDYRP